MICLSLTHKPSEYSPTFAAPIFPLPLSRLGLYNSCLCIKNSAILRYYNNQETTGTSGFSSQNLWYTRQFYLEYREYPNLQQVVGEIPERAHQGQEALQPALNVGLVEMTIPDKLRSSKQKYRFTDKGKEWVEQNQA